MPSINLAKVHLTLKLLLTTNSKCGGDFLCRRYKSDRLQLHLSGCAEIKISAISEFMLFISCTSESSPYKANSWKEDWKGEEKD